MQVIAADLSELQDRSAGGHGAGAQGAKLPLPAGLEPATLGCPKKSCSCVQHRCGAQLQVS